MRPNRLTVTNIYQSDSVEHLLMRVYAYEVMDFGLLQLQYVLVLLVSGVPTSPRGLKLLAQCVD